MKKPSKQRNENRQHTGWSPIKWAAKDHLERVESIDLSDEAELSDLRASAIDRSSCHTSAISMEECWFDNLSLSGALIKKMRANDVEFEHCDLSNALLEQARLSKVRFSNCRLTGTNLSQSRISGAMFSDSAAALMHAFGAHFDNVLFERCVLKNADFRACQFSQVTFKDCDLEGAEFYDAHFDATDMRGSSLRAIRISAGDLSGVTLSKQQLTELSEFLAQLLGITVVE